MTRKFNIAIFCDPINQVGGSFVSTLRFAELLAKRNNKVIILAAKYKKNKDIDWYKGVKIYRLPSVLVPKSEGAFRFIIPNKSKIREILKKEEIDLLHIMLPFPAAISALKTAKSLNLNVVGHSHIQPENVFLHLPKFTRKDSFYKLFNKYLIWFYEQTELVICPSKFSERWLKKYSPNLRTMVISNGVNLDKFRKKDYQNLMKKYKLSMKKKKIVFVGRLHPEKDIETLINAVPYILKEYNNVEIEIVGGGYLEADLIKLIHKLGVENDVKLLGRISDEELIMAYNASDIFVLPSVAELEGMVVLEAMACGKPILIANSKSSASADFVDGNGLLFKSKSPIDLAKKAIYILKNDKIRKKMGEMSYRSAKNYDINKSIISLEKVYSKLI